MNNLKQKILNKVNQLPLADREAALRAISSAVSGDGSDYTALWEADYEDRPPTIEEFIDKQEYLGKMTHNLFPIWRRELATVFDPVNPKTEWIIRGAIGTGKTTAAVIGLLYKTALTLHLKNPQEYYGIMEGAPIVVAFFNILKYLSEDVGFGYFKQALQVSPFFSRIGKRNRQGDVVGMPKNILFAIGAESAHALGQNILIGHLDEANYGKKSTKPGEKNQVQNLYTETRDRIDSRYLREGSGINPGFLIITSSERDESDFLTKHCEKVKSDKQVHISQFALWDAKTSLQTGKWFSVFAGDERRDPKVLSEDEVSKYEDTGRVIKVPESTYFRKRFSYDIQGALRNQAGIGTYGHMKFLPNRSLFHACQDRHTPRPSPFSVETAKLGLHPDQTLTRYFVKENIVKLVDKSNNKYKPIYHPSVGRCVHVDLAKNKDHAGIAMGCTYGSHEVDQLTEDGSKIRVLRHRIWVDFMLQIEAELGSEIDFEKIRKFLTYLQAIGFNFSKITYDGWQSLESIQMLKKEGYDAAELSVDRTKNPYNALKAVIYSQCLNFYPYKVFEEEILELLDLDKKVDHLPDKSKDVSDAVAGMVYNLLMEKGTNERDYFDTSHAEFIGAVEGTSIFGQVKSEQPLESVTAVSLDELFED